MPEPSFDQRARAAERQEGQQAELLRSKLRTGELPRLALELRAHAGDALAREALAEAEAPTELAAWIEALGLLDRRAWVCAPLVGAALCTRLLATWPAGESSARVLEVALCEVARAAISTRDTPGSGRLDPRRSAEQALQRATQDMDQLHQLMESIQVEHGLSGLGEPRALACGLAAVEALRVALYARRGATARPGLALAACAQALGAKAELWQALRTSVLAGASRVERQASLGAGRGPTGPKSKT